MMQLISTAASSSKQNSTNLLNINTISSCMQTNNSNSSVNANLKYTNPPLPPRFLALSAQQQQQVSAAASSVQSVLSSTCNSSNNSTNSIRNLGQQAQPQQQPPQQPQRNMSLPQQPKPQNGSNITQSNVTSGNSLNSFIAARNLAIQTNATANVFNLQNHYQQAQQQSAYNTLANPANGCNTSTAALIASLAAATSNKQLINTQSNHTQQVIQPPSSMPTTQCTLNNTLFVGNLHASLQEIDLIQVFRPFGRIVECCKKWLHFGFVKFSTEEEACHAYVTLNGFRLKGRPMRLEFQNRTKKARIKAILAQAALQASKNQEFEETLLSQISASNQSPLNMLLSARMHQQNMQNINKQLSFNQATKYNNYGQQQTQFTQMQHQQQQQQQQQQKQNDCEFTFFDTEKLLKFAIGNTNETQADACDSKNLPSYVEQAWNSAENQEAKATINSNRLTNDETTKYGCMDDLSIGINLNSLLSMQSEIKPEQYSPLQDQHSASSSSSSLLSRSSFDSSSSCWGAGVTTTTCFSENDSGIDQQKQQAKNKAIAKPSSRCETPQDFSLSEHLEFTYSGSSSTVPSSSNVVQVLNKQNLKKFTQQQNGNKPSSRKCSKKSTNFNCDDDLEDHIEVDEESSTGDNDNDTIDDASVIPTDIDINQDNNDNEADEDDDICLNFDANFKEMCNIRDIAKTDFGMYGSINENAKGLFIEHEDVLRPIGFNDYTEYRLFPNMPPNNYYHTDIYNSNVF